jgi:hypothetical protein
MVIPFNLLKDTLFSEKKIGFGTGWRIRSKLTSVLIDPPPFLLSSKNEKQAEESKNLFSQLSIKDFYLIP